jgi:hydrogenase nickel incorporation protein HypA/HybF
MHELSVTEQLLGIVLDHARKAEAKRVLKVNLVIGELTSFVGESIQFYFDMLSKETEAEGASLSIFHIPAKATCKQCKMEFHPEGMDWFCPACKGAIQEVLAGREFYVESIEVE